jgi:thiol-disulfide isomerase/thioredoxin
MGVAAWLLPLAMAVGQDDIDNPAEGPTPKTLRPATSDESLQAINDAYNRELLQLERRRLERVARLAARQNPAEAAVTYEQLFRLAIAASLFEDAGPIAETVVKSGSPSPTTTALAYLVKVIAESDRGAYEQSLESLRQAIAEADKAARSGAPRAALLTSEKVALCDAYYQRLVHGDQLETARKAFQLLRERVRDPALADFLSSRLQRLDQVGRPAPAIRGTDLDGKPYNLADAKGKVVLVVFWASWCLPCAAEVEWFQQVAESYRTRGLQVVGINLDVLQDDGPKVETVLPNIRHFLLDHNVRWPTLINGSGDKDYAKVYGVTEVPANVLIARDGTVVQLDLVRKNLEPVIARVVGQ